MFKVKNTNIKATSMTWFTLNIFTPFSSACVVDFKQVNVSWDSFLIFTAKIKNGVQKRREA